MRQLTNCWARSKRSARWYQGISPDDVRLSLKEEGREINFCFSSRENAQRVYNQFRAGTYTLEEIYQEFKL